ncbi:MAG TPA: Gfo/Idh/MocA family oxidoreductase [Candidatus Latescibacteria bacterium]|nr:Gfo/Idh/MocA family oxidoreductase [Candidatus Latescibacterota bacterium]HRS93716.1 Gfo/Idh/MocA family oxidoreductase [Candidatus Latescibacterota bacterium]HRU23433.1 Gfo/Idh/MocA family oxidoreductase [Candidatus Latescibacterota bacterium]
MAARVRVAMLGAGAIAQDHLRALRFSSRAEIVGIADVNLSLAQKAAAEFGGTAFADYHDMLDRLKPSAVVVCTPPKFHRQHVEDCARAGSDVLCEKPLALTVPECDFMISAVKKAGRQLMAGQVLRYYAGPKTLIEIARSGKIGTVVTCWSTRVGYYDPAHGPSWRYDPKIGGGTAIEWEVHEIDLLRMLAGEAKTVSGRVLYTRPDSPEFDDHVHAVMTMGEGAIGRIDASNSSYYSECTRGVVGTTGAAWCGWGDVSLRTAGSNDVQIVKPVLPEVPENVNVGMFQQDDAFLEALQADRPVPIPGEEGRADVAVAAAILLAGKTGETVRL